MKALESFATALLACAALTTQAAPPLVYTSNLFATDAVALAGAAADVESLSGTLTGLPLVADAVTTSGANFASAVGIAAAGLLVAQSEASSTGEPASAVASASFEGGFSIAGPTQLQFSIRLTDQDFTGVGQYSNASLLFRVTFAGATYADLLLTGSDSPVLLTITLPGSGPGLMGLLLASEANALSGDASNFAQAEFAAAVVPEPATRVLMLLGAIALYSMHRRWPRFCTNARAIARNRSGNFVLPRTAGIRWGVASPP